MKPTLILCVLMIGVGEPASAAWLWETNFTTAADAAESSNRYMLLDFTGSDWCGWCIRLDKEVFSTPEFKKYAKDNLVCVEVDFPRRKTLKKSLVKQNQELKRKYQVRGYPTVVILSPKGNLVTRTGYQQGGAKKYIKHLEGFINPHRKKHNVPDPTPIEKSSLKKRSTTLSNAQRPKPLARDENRASRTWTSKRGATVTASVLEEKGVYVILKRENGTTIKILASMLSDKDKTYVAGLRKKALAQSQEPRGED